MPRQVRDYCSAERPELPSCFVQKPFWFRPTEMVKDDGPYWKAHDCGLGSLLQHTSPATPWFIFDGKLGSCGLAQMACKSDHLWADTKTEKKKKKKAERNKIRSATSSLHGSLNFFLHFTFSKLKNNVSNNLRRETLAIQFTGVPLGLSHEVGLCL